MRIGLISGEYPPMQGGVGAYSQIMARQFAERGHDVFVMSDPQARESDPRIKLDRVKNWSIGSLLRIRRWAKHYQLDLISLQFETAAYAMSPWVHFLPQTIKIPVVTTFHDLLFPYLFPKAGRLRDWIVMHLARISAGVIATNHEDMARLKHLLCTMLIPIGSNITRALPPDYNAQSWRTKAGAAPDDFVLAYFGFINRSKGLDTLLEALVLFKDRLPTRLVMIGGRTGSSDPSNAAYSAEIDILIEQLGIADSIFWTGFADDATVSVYLNTCDVVVLPFRDGASYRRGTLMAAVDHGCAIITTQPKVEIPMFRDGENMLFFPPGDAHALANAMLQFHEMPDAAKQKLRNNALELSKNFDWANITQDYMALFDRVLGENR